MSIAILWFSASLVQEAYAQNQKKKEAEKKETYTRPKPTQPIKPTIPSVNRFQEDKVFLEQADSLFRPKYDMEEKQIVKGNVKFRQAGLWMFCDSAYYYPEQNSLDAFGHVIMKQGDTVFVYSDKLYYDGTAKKAILTRGPSQNKVKLQEKDRRGKVKMTLTTDSLDYDIGSEIGWYTTGGELEDGVNTLTSVYGQYSPATKTAEFRYDVVLVNHKDDYKMFTDVLLYNTETHVADITTHTRIEGQNDTIVTTSGWYNTSTDNAELTSRSTIIHRDSAMNVTTLEGDSIIYDKATRISRAYMFRSPLKNQQPMVLTDTARKMILIGGYGEYNDSTRGAFATEYPLLMDFSRPDTLFLRADTILTSMRIEMVFPENYIKPLSNEARARLEALGSLQAIAETMHLEIKLLPDDLIEVTPKSAANTGESTPPAANPKAAGMTTPDSVERKEGEKSQIGRIGRKVLGAASELPEDSVGQRRDSMVMTDETVISDSTVVFRDSTAVFREEETETEVTEDSLPDGGTFVEIDSTEIKKIKTGPRLDSIGRDSNDMVPKEYRVAKAYHRARFFNQDMQGIADSMEYQEYDSMLYLFRRPIVWSGEREVTGGRIDVHFNDSAPDWALLPETGMMAEYIDEDFYNQLSGKKMKAFFENKELTRLEVDGNVETIFLPMEEDSTYNRLVNAESSYMTIDLTEKKMDKLKMWPEVSGTVTPLFMVKNSQKRLQGFTPHFDLRPEREWYGDRIRWADNLGEIPEAVERYFDDSSNTVVRKKAVSPFAKKTPPAASSEEKAAEGEAAPPAEISEGAEAGKEKLQELTTEEKKEEKKVEEKEKDKEVRNE